MNAPQFTDLERRILAIAGDDLPHGPEPYKEIARACGAEEETVIGLLARLKDQGIIRRFGATLRHRKAGYGHNAMAAWRTEGAMDPVEAGRFMAARPEISHCYLRKTRPGWPYDLYTMLHGEKPGDCERLAEALSRETGMDDYCILKSISELKKSSMKYF